MIPLLIGGIAVLLILSVRTSKLEGGTQAAANAVLGLAALLAVNRTAAYTGIQVGLNIYSAAVSVVLGVPGVVLLALVQWVLGSP
ncbi:MAG: pro-sigmaK processing inhibitor BofA family protein, partial [Oscillospiraceae bacterium]|nr:pro-sigmaK processing inhibitor BofA family protein [Oscillospiraceae bacterium]